MEDEPGAPCPGDWYLDAVMQGACYDGGAFSRFANPPARQTGFALSFETGCPIPLSAFGPRFELEPRAGRPGLPGQWSIAGANVRANL